MTFDPATDPHNVTATALGGTAFADLAELRADATYGDGIYAGPAFGAWDFVLLGDGSIAFYDAGASVWVEGATPPALPLDGSIRADLDALKRLTGAISSSDDDLLSWSLAAAEEWIYARTMRCDHAAPGVQEAILLLASRIYSRRRSPDGSAGFGPEGSVVRVLASDPDIARLIERHLEMLTVGIG